MGPLNFEEAQRKGMYSVTKVEMRRFDEARAIGLRVKLSRGLKLCKLRGRFLARVNNVNYIVNYKIFARARDLNKSRVYSFRGYIEGATALYTHSFNSKTPPACSLSTSSFATTPISLALDFFTGEIGHLQGSQ